MEFANRDVRRVRNDSIECAWGRRAPFKEVDASHCNGRVVFSTGLRIDIDSYDSVLVDALVP